MIAQVYPEDWLEELDDFNLLINTGMALYDFERCEDVLTVFVRTADSVPAGNKRGLAIALIWQRHMLDLLDRRDEAIGIYRRVVDLDVRGGGAVRHDQYGLAYDSKSYALERTKVPFTRLENIWEDLISR